MDFEYTASVIVPVYNVENYLRECLDSLVNQTIDKSKLEVLVINDGSPDNSWGICQEYSEKYDFIKIFSKENEGLSATRNYGIRHAKGKYMFFLDSDDYFTSPTVEKVCDYFDKVYDQVDMVTYNEFRYNDDGVMRGQHYRFKTLTDYGVYDLNEYPYLGQTRVNVCVKNVSDENIFFDTTPGFKLEDQEYCNRILIPKMKLGYCPEGAYMYNKGNESSIVSMYFHAYYLFETSMKYFETLFGYFKDGVPAYFQSMLINDISWRLKADILYPYHYEDEKFKSAMDRIVALLNKVDTDVLLNHPSINIYQGCYWLKLRGNADISIQPYKKGLKLVVDGEDAYMQDDFVIIGHKPRIEKDTFKLTGFVKSPIFNFVDEPVEVYAIENGEYKKLDIFMSVHSHYQAKIVTNYFPAFHYQCNIKDNKKIEFAVKLNGKMYKSHFWFMGYSGFSRVFKTIKRGKYMISNKKKYLKISKAGSAKTALYETAHTVPYMVHPRVAKLRLDSIKYRNEHRIWLYYDFYTVNKDNGYYQFINDLKHDDGIERYYVLTHEYENIDEFFTPEQQKHLVKAGTPEHRLLYVCAERIFTAYYGLAPINPFDSARQHNQYNDLLKFRTVYLQHGVLHASLRLNNSEERSRAEQIVVSSPFEVENYIKNYAYSKEDLITTGMTRYDHIDKNKQPQKRILFAPSWRKYLTTEIKASNWSTNYEKLKKSEYYINFLNFLLDKKLHQCLIDNNVYLDIKLHPIIADAKDLFVIDCPNINMVSGEVDVSDYSAFVTDFSSYVFDFAYLVRPIMYFVPDYPQFKSGMNHYRDLDLPFEDAFGKMFTDAEKAADCLCSIINSEFKPEELYKKRMEDFYFKFDGHCAENFYQYIINQDKELQ